MSPDTSVLIAKLDHAVSAEAHLAHRNMSHIPNARHHLDLMPTYINEWMNSHHVMRLSTILEILDRKPVHQIPSHRLLAYCYDTLYAAEFIIDGENGERVIDHPSAIVRTDLDSTSLPPTYDDTICYTVSSRMKTGLDNPHAPLLQLDFGGTDTFYVLEQLWFVLKKEPVQSPNPWELVNAEPQYIPNSPLSPTYDERSISDSDVDTHADGVYTSDEEDDTIEQIQQ
ncbi:hypothetical protein Aduo_007874 [Ancylostoma duodenale]